MSDRGEFGGVKLPASGAEWQEAVDAAAHLLWLESARMYGLITGGPAVDVGRCQLILETGKRLGFTPGELRIENLITEIGLVAPGGKEPPE